MNPKNLVILFALLGGCFSLQGRVVTIGCVPFFLDGVGTKTDQKTPGLWQIQKIPFTGWETWFAAQGLPDGRTLVRIGRTADAYRDCVASAEVCRSHLDRLSEVTLDPAFSAYGVRRSDWDPFFTDLLRKVAPTFRSDARTIVILNEDNITVDASIRIVPSFSQPNSDAVVGYGYPNPTAFRAAVVDWSTGLPLFVPPKDEWASFALPPAHTPGEQILGIEVDRTNLEVIWELTNLYIRSDLPPTVRRELWLRLWRAGIQHLFFNRDSFKGQSLFTYGSEKSLKLYRPLGITKLNAYRLGGKWVQAAPGQELPPIKIGKTNFWPLGWTPQAIKEFHAKLVKSGQELVGAWPLDEFEESWQKLKN